MGYNNPPSEADIQRVMRETSMERIQAINHLLCREQLRNRSGARGPLAFPAPSPPKVVGVEVTMKVLTSLGPLHICVRRVNPSRWVVFVDGGFLADGRDQADFPSLGTALSFAGQEVERAASVDEEG